jgi:gliding motility-associated-like protein
MRKFLLFIFVILGFCGNAQTININTGGTVNACSGTFVDPGGAGANYGNNQNFTQTICSSTPGQCVVFMFNSFELESTFDYLDVYDGVGTGNFLFTLDGGPTSFTFPVASSTGCLTFVFHSDNNMQLPGWTANISCIPCPLLQAATQQDCIGAIPICQEQYYNPNSYIGEGPDPNEINSITSCLSGGETNDAWYTFTAQTSGNFSFVLTPNNSSNDYDWALYDVTTNGCAGIFSGLSPEINCNYSASTTLFSGQTGANSLSPYFGSFTSQGAGGSAFNASSPIVAGNTYALNISNFSSSNFGYFLDLTPSTASLFDNTPPAFIGISTPPCGSSAIFITFSEPVLCSSLQATDFTITNTSTATTYTVTSATSFNCTNLTSLSTTFFLTASPAFTSAGTYSINLVGSVTDKCGNPISLASFPFVISQTTSAGPDTTICALSIGMAAMAAPATYTGTWTQISGPGVSTFSNANSPNAIITASISGTYIYQWQINNGAGCIVNDQVNVTFGLTEPTFSSVANICVGASIPVLPTTSTNGIPGTWSPTLNNLATTTYTFTPGIVGCIDTTSLTIIVQPLNTPTFLPITPICYGTPISALPVTSTNGIFGTWSPAPNNTTSTTYTFTPSSSQCAFTTTTTINVIPITTSALSINVCSNNLPYIWNGQSLTGNGTYSHTQLGANGCDSVTTLNFSVTPITSININASACANTLPYVWNTQNISSTGIYTDTSVSANGCDSVTILNFTVIPTTNATIAIAVCPSALPYIWNGQSLTGNGTYSSTQLGANGCDSITTLNFSVTPITSININASACANTLPYVWNTQNIFTSGVYTDTAVNANGCDSVTILNFTVIPTTNATIAIAVCPSALPYNWNGQSLTSNGTYSSTQLSANGCDSITTLNFTVIPTTNATIAITVCPSALPYIWNGQSLTTNGTYLNTQLGANGCDSITTLNFSVTPITNTNINASACANALPYVWNTQNISSTGIYTDTSVSANGCDSVTILNFTVIPTTNATITIAVCPSALPYLWNGQSLTGNGTYANTQLGANGCDSITTLNFSVTPITSININASACANTLPYVWNTQNILTSGIYTDTTVSANGCDSVTILNFTVLPTTNATIAIAVCPSALPYIWNGQSLTTNGTYSNTQLGANGCDSVTTLNFSVTPITTININASACANTLPYVWNTQNISSTGVYTDTSVSINGCDSVTILNFTVIPTTNATITIAVCQSALPYIWNGQSLTGNGTYSNTQLGANGCDSVTTLNFSITPITSININASACANTLPYVWNTQNILTSGIYTDTTVNANGCDSVTILNFTVIPTTNTTIAIAVCPSALPYIWNGQSLTGNGTYSSTHLGANGCDSVTTLNFSVTPITSININASACANTLPYVWNTQNISSTGIYTDTSVSANGCDSVTILNFTVIPTTNATIAIAVCPSALPYTWNGQSLTSNGTYSSTQLGANGCDSITTLNFSVTPITSININASACANTLPYVWNTQNIFTSGVYTDTAVNANGCDSVTILNFTVIPTTNATITIAVCPSALPYIWNGQSLTSNGTYSHTQLGANGCDSVTTLNFSVTPITSININASACANALPFVWNSQNISSTGIYTDTSVSINGCDSVTILNFTVLPTTNATITIAVCPSALPYIWNGQSLTGNGTYANTQLGANGCDSITTLNFSVTPITSTNINASACANALPFVWNTQNIFSTGIYTDTSVSANGCDSVTILNFTVIPTVIPIFDTLITQCVGASLPLLPTISINGITGTWSPALNNLVSTTYTFTPSTGACASSTTLFQNIKSPAGISATITNTYCGNATGTIQINSVLNGSAPFVYTINNGIYINNSTFNNLFANTYTISVQDVFGCKYDTLLDVNNTAGPTGISYTKISATCGNMNGQISNITAVGGVPPYVYSINALPYSAVTNYTALPTGIYTIIARDSNNCTFTIIDSIMNIDGPNTLLLDINNGYCGLNTGSINIQNVVGGVPPYLFSINGAAPSSINQFNNLAVGMYTLLAVDANNCTLDTTITIVDQPGPIGLQLTVLATNCAAPNGSISIGVPNGGTAPYSYSINGQPFSTNSVINNLQSGTYTVTVKDNNGCTYATTAIVGSSVGITNFVLSSTNETCSDSNGTITIGAVQGGVAPYQYALNNGALSNITFYNNLIAGEYVITVTDANGCSLTKSITLTNNLPITDIELTSTKSSCLIDDGVITTNITGGEGPYTYAAQPGNFINNIGDFNNLVGPKSYTVTVTDALGCSITSTAFIAKAVCCKEVFVPTAFSPNGDNINDEFKPIMADNLEIREFIITNRLGQIIYSNTDKSVGWVGYYKGIPCDIGTYFYYIRYYCPVSYSEYVIKGDFTLVK